MGVSALPGGKNAATSWVVAKNIFDWMLSINAKRSGLVSSARGLKAPTPAATKHKLDAEHGSNTQNMRVKKRKRRSNVCHWFLLTVQVCIKMQPCVENVFWRGGADVYDTQTLTCV